MNRHLSNRLASLALAIAFTFGLAWGIHRIAASQAAMAAAEVSAAQMAQSTGAPLCARV